MSDATPRADLPGRSWTLSILGRQIPLGRSGTLTVSRFADQAVLGAASLVLAWRLGVEGFVPISALLVVNSFAVVASDFGLGTAILRREIGGLSGRVVRRLRVANLGISLVTVLVGVVAVDGSSQAVVIGSALVWASSAEAYVRKSALLRLERVGRAAIAEMVGSAFLVAGIVGALVRPSDAVWIVVAGLFGKHIGESIACVGWDRVLSVEGERRWDLWLWGYAVVNFAILNVDFVLIAVLVSHEAFAIYSVGFRVASALVSQVGYVFHRVVLVDFGDGLRDHRLAEVYRHRRGQMWWIGIGAAAVTGAASPLLFLLGAQWHDVVGVVVVLAWGVPWKMTGGVGLNLLAAADGAKLVTRWELTRLVLVVLAFVAAGRFGLWAFTATAAAVEILAGVGYDRLAIRFSRATGRSPIVTFAFLAVPLATVTSWIALT